MSSQLNQKNSDLNKSAAPDVHGATKNLNQPTQADSEKPITKGADIYINQKPGTEPTKEAEDISRWNDEGGAVTQTYDKKQDIRTSV